MLKCKTCHFCCTVAALILVFIGLKRRKECLVFSFFFGGGGAIASVCLCGFCVGLIVRFFLNM